MGPGLVPEDRPHVPEWLRGCWQRAWIEFDDGSRNDTDTVFWLQTSSSMADIRIPGQRPPFDGVESLSACSSSQLSALAGSIASTGFTTCSATSEESADGSRSCVAEWFSYGHGTNFQPVCSFPEPGHLLVDQDGTVMIERAPSGRYVEEWHLVAGSRDGRPRHSVLVDGRQLFVTGSVAVVVRDRVVALPHDSLPHDSLIELAADGKCARPELEALLDCEFSVALQGGDGVYRITASTLPWREGQPLDAAV
jgi:hypothetical protein